LDLAEGREPIQDALDLIRRRLKPARIILTPTPLQELVFLSQHSEKQSERQQALVALRSLAKHGLELLKFHSRCSRHCRTILLTSDAHLRSMDFERASVELRMFDVEMPVVATPRELLRKFSS
jgi:hypothetical protein